MTNEFNRSHRIDVATNKVQALECTEPMEAGGSVVARYDSKMNNAELFVFSNGGAIAGVAFDVGEGERIIAAIREVIDLYELHKAGRGQEYNP